MLDWATFHRAWPKQDRLPSHPMTTAVGHLRRPVKHGDYARKGLALDGAENYAFVSPSFLAADAHLFRRTLSLGVTLLDAASIDPGIVVAQ